jgi:hypothetical protein
LDGRVRVYVKIKIKKIEKRRKEKKKIEKGKEKKHTDYHPFSFYVHFMFLLFFIY